MTLQSAVWPWGFEPLTGATGGQKHLLWEEDPFRDPRVAASTILTSGFHR